MTIDSAPPSPIGSRLRSRTAGNRETHETSDARFQDGFRRDPKPQPPPHHGRPSQDGSFTFHRHNTEPQSPGDAAPSARNVDTSQNRDNFSQVMYTNRVLREENELLKRENGKLEERARTVDHESRDLRQNVLSLRRDVERKSLECSNLRAEVKDLAERSNAPASQGMVWPFTFFQGTRSSHNSAENPIAELQRKAAEYERNIGELVAENYQLQHRAADCERKIGEVGAENCKLQRKAGDYERKVKELQAENYKLQRRAADCERKIGELGAENCKLQRKDAERKEQMQLQTTRFAAELKAIRNKDFVNIPNLSDAAVQGNWRTLCFSVRQFVSIHLPESLDLSTIEALAGSEAFSWLPNASKTLQAPLFCPILLESWVWHFLCIRIFDPSSTYWAGEEGKTWAILCGGFRDRLSDSGRSHPSASTIAEFHDWRVRSAHFVSKLDKRNPDNMVKAETTNLLKLLEAVTNDREGTGDMYRDAHGIIRQATELDQFFRLARADFHVFITRVKLPLVHPPNLGFQFDPETMERAKVIPVAGQHAGAAVVDLAISPGLIKAGNCDGSNYHHERVLVKLQALCDLQPTLRFLEERRMSVEEGGRH